MTFDVADGVCAVQCIEMAMKKHADVFEKRKAIILAVYKQDVAEARAPEALPGNEAADGQTGRCASAGGTSGPL